MASIFICYRREDTSAEAGRLAADLCGRFGESNVFIDIDSIAPGADFEERIERALDACRFMFVLIGDRWLSTGKDGRRRIEDDRDYVRKEVAAALRRLDLDIVPVLVEGTEMPSPGELPSDVAPLARHNAAELSYRRWRYDVDQLAEIAAREEGASGHRPRLVTRTRVAAAIAIAVVIAVALVAAKLDSGGGSPAPTALTAQITEAQAFPGVTLSNFLNAEPGRLVDYRRKAESQGLSASELSPALRTEGVTATFTLELTGTVGTALEVHRALFEASAQARISEGTTTVVPPPRYVLHSARERIVDGVWIARPKSKPGTYVVELEVLDARGERLAYRQTPPFRL